jgi:glutamine amidotransferase
MIAIVNYEAGNLTSVWRAFQALKQPALITGRAEEILAAERVVFPGQGHGGAGMASLRKLGLDKVLRTVFERGTPLLGICLGAQIVLDYSQESDTVCLGLLPGQTVRFPDNHHDHMGQPLKVPHMGWNSLSLRRPHPVLEQVPDWAQFYFVHSYYPVPQNEEHIVAQSNFGLDFTSVLACRNLLATQFHPEKSGRPGLSLLANFAAWDGQPS